jgi:hypothetical protein
VLFVIAILALGVKALPAPKSNQNTQTSQSSPSSAPSTNVSSAYKDGTYMATGKYNSPGGPQSIVVSLTVANSAVTDANVEPKATGGVAQIYQSYFVDGYKQYVVGKKLNDIRVSRVSSSSLNSKGFNDALKQIEMQAKM